MTDIVTPDECEIEKVKADIKAMTKKAELEQLKQELAEITQKAVNTPNEFEGAMQVPDTEKVLTTKRKRPQFFDLVFERLRGMFAVRPIVGNIIAIGLSFFAMYYIYTQVQGTVIAEYQPYMGTGMCVFSALQVLKSSTRSILLPILALMIGSAIAHTLKEGEMLLGHAANFYQYMMGVGIVGVGVAVLSIG